MRKVLATIILSVLVLYVKANSTEENIDSLFMQGNAAYAARDYQMAIMQYDKIDSIGYNSAGLYFNIGNCYYKLSNYPKAILYYERALVLDPGNSDILFNLNKTQTYTIDKINEIEFFVKNWMESLINLLNSNSWGIVSLIAFILTLLFLYLGYIAMRNRKQLLIGFSTMFFVIFFITLLFSLNLANHQTKANSAIVMSPSVTIKSSPDEEGRSLFIIHEGTKVKTIRLLEGWYEIKLSDGKQGWLRKTDIEEI